MDPDVSRTALLRRWHLTLRAAGTTATPQTVDRQGHSLIAAWSMPHRRYHDLAHLFDVLTALDTLTSPTRDHAEPHTPRDHAELHEQPGPADPDLVAAQLAAWFHDAVHDGRPGHDERDSAALAERSLAELELDASLIARVARLIMFTADHSAAPDGDTAAALLLDADLAVLGRDPDGYAAYAAAIREEYAAVPEPEFRAGRRAVLQRLSARDPLYRTESGRRLWQRAARRNLTAEIASLSD